MISWGYDGRLNSSRPEVWRPIADRSAPSRELLEETALAGEDLHALFHGIVVMTAEGLQVGPGQP